MQFLPWIILGIIILLIGYHILCRGHAQSNGDYNKLLVKTLGDKSKAERLIEYERKTYPNAGRNILIKEAIKRLERDNR